MDVKVHKSNKFLLCLNSQNRFSLWNLMTCSLIFHRKIKLKVINIHFINEKLYLLSGIS